MKRQFPGPLSSVGLSFLFLAMQAVVAFLIIPVYQSQGVTLLFGVSLPAFAIIFISARVNDFSFPRAMGWGRIRWKRLFPVVIMTIAMVFIVVVIEKIISGLFIPPDLYEIYEKEYLDAFFLENPGDLVFGILAIVVVGPIMEESLFRGVIFGGLKSHIGRGGGIIVSSVLFMLTHVNPIQFPATLTLGLIYAIMISRGYRTSETFIAHAIHNGISMLFLFGILDFSLLSPEGIIETSLLAMFFILMGVVFWVSFKHVIRGFPSGDVRGGE